MGNRFQAEEIINRLDKELMSVGVLCENKRKHIIKTMRANFSMNKLLDYLKNAQDGEWIYYFRFYEEYGGDFQIFTFEPSDRKKNLFEIRRR